MGYRGALEIYAVKDSRRRRRRRTKGAYDSQIGAEDPNDDDKVSVVGCVPSNSYGATKGPTPIRSVDRLPRRARDRHGRPVTEVREG